MARVRRVRADEWAALRELRLRALADAPEAFLTTLEQAKARPDSSWREAAARGAAGDRWCTVVADNGLRLIGMASGYFPGERQHPLDEASVVSVIQMWVEPAARRGGVGRALAIAILDWASARGSPVTRLEVNPDQLDSVAFYRALGFRETGRRASYAERKLTAIEMERISRA